MGFSLPQTDLLVSSMPATTLPKKSVITPINRDESIVKRVRDTFQIPDRSRRVNKSFAKESLESPIAAWVEANTQQ